MAVSYYGNRSNEEAMQLLRESITNPPPAIAIDVETISITERTPLGFGLALTPYDCYYFDTYPEPDEGVEKLIPLLANPKVVKVAHNLPFDMKAFPLIPRIGDSLDRTNIFDTLVAARLLGYLEVQLAMLVGEVGFSTTPMGEIMKKHGASTSFDVPRDELAAHCAQDVAGTLALYYKYMPKIESQYHEYFKVEMRTIPLIVELGLRGMKIDQQARQDMEDRIRDEMEFYSRYIISHGVKNPNSAQQVGYILAKRQNFLPFTKGGKTGKKQLKTSKEELEFLDDPLATAILSYRHNRDILNKYLVPLKDYDRIFTDYSMDLSVGRLSSANFNLQNIPSKKSKVKEDVRSIILPDNGIFTSGDYSQEHLYIIMEMSGDKAMRRVYEEGYMDGDIHLYTAHEMGIERQFAKTINYAIAYGATAKSISQQSKIRDIRRCGYYLDKWMDTFRDAAYWIRCAKEEAKRTGWTLPTLHGRKFRLNFGEREDEIERKSINYPVIGTDGENMKRALLVSQDAGLGPPIMCVTVHDSISWDGDVLDRVPVEAIENVCSVRIPFEMKQTYKWE
jgi:DNA polymerase-1